MLKNQDIVVLLALIGREREDWDFVSLGQSLELSASAVHRAIGRLAHAGLYDANGGSLRPAAALEFLVHAAKFVAPLREGPAARGVPTGAVAPPLDEMLSEPPGDAAAASWVWPHPSGVLRGVAVEPLIGSAPEIALRDPAMHRRLAALDALRGGRVRERRLAEAWFRGELRLS